MIGNIFNINIRTTNCGVGGTDSLDKAFDYDPLYRVTSGTGRENLAGINYPFPGWNDQVRDSDPNATQAYTRKYAYDKVGNVQQIKQLGISGFTRDFNYVSNSNKLNDIEIGINHYNFTYDAAGNQLTENTERHFEWDAQNRLILFKNQVGSSEPSVMAQYLYDSSGNRVKKIVRKQGGDYEIRTYIDGLLEYFTDEIDEQNTVNIMDNQSRIATIRIGDDMGDPTPAVKYNLENNIYSSAVILDEVGSIVNTQEYYPFGETSFGSYAKKRYQYVGKERDEESGLYYYGARYYAPWIARFISTDPLSVLYVQLSPYNYSDNNPINDYDIDGMQNNNTPQAEHRNGNDPNSETEKAYRTEKVKEQLNNGVNIHDIHFVYENFANDNGDIGNLTYSYEHIYFGDKEYTRETWHHEGQKIGYSYGTGVVFDATAIIVKLEDEKKDKDKIKEPEDDDKGSGGGIDETKEEDKKEGGGNPKPKKPKLTQSILDAIVSGGSLFNIDTSGSYKDLSVNKAGGHGTAKGIADELSKYQFQKVTIHMHLFFDGTYVVNFGGDKEREKARQELLKEINDILGPKIKLEFWFTRDPSKESGSVKAFFK